MSTPQLSETEIKLINLIERMDIRITLGDERVTALNELVQIMNAQLDILKKQVDLINHFVLNGCTPHLKQNGSIG